MIYEENDRVELKREIVDDMDKEIIAFLNSKGGTIFVGITDDGEVIGVVSENKEIYEQKLSSIITEGIKPTPRNQINFYYNEENILVIDIDEGIEKPYYLSRTGPRPGGTYIRIGRTKQQATDGEILSMIMDSRKYSYETEISKNQDLHFDYLFTFSKKKNVDINDRSFLSLGMQNKEGKYTNLGLLFSEENPIEVKFAVYDQNLNFKRKKEFTGSLLEVIDKVLDYADLLNTTSAIIVPYQPQRIETRSYPDVSLREAILNAFCHADYRRPSNIKIEFYDDHVDIMNPGSIYDGSLEDILKGYQTFRNPGLVRILAKLDYIENYGKGMKRIQEAYEKETRKPSFDVTAVYFKISLPDLNYHK